MGTVERGKREGLGGELVPGFAPARSRPLWFIRQPVQHCASEFLRSNSD